MRKYSLLILLTILSLKCFSQKDTNNLTLKTNVARLVVKDLVRLDGCVEEKNELNQKIFMMNQLIIQKDSQMTILNLKNENLQYQVDMKDREMAVYDDLTNTLKKEIRSEKTKRGLYKYTTWLFLLTTVYFLKFQ